MSLKKSQPANFQDLSGIAWKCQKYYFKKKKMGAEETLKMYVEHKHVICHFI